MKLLKVLFTILSLGYLISCQSSKIKVPDSPYPISDDSFLVDTIAQGLIIPYGIAIVEENEYFITDRIGKFYHFKDGQQTEIAGMPEVVTFGTPGIPAILHGGLMDVSIHPDYATNAWIYLTYLHTDGLAKVARLKIQDNAVTLFEPIFATRRTNYTGNGMRIVWEDSTHFFLNVGNSDWSSSTV